MKRIFLNKIKAAEDLVVLQESKRKEGSLDPDGLSHRRYQSIQISPDEKK